MPDWPASLALNSKHAFLRQYEAQNIIMPDTISGPLQLKMYENLLKQKDLAKLLETSNTQLHK
ncbi:MAG: hypothetical protein QM594_17975 [Niabella sp.]